MEGREEDLDKRRGERKISTRGGRTRGREEEFDMEVREEKLDMGEKTNIKGRGLPLISQLQTHNAPLHLALPTTSSS
jgi:hypothetical protein